MENAVLLLQKGIEAQRAPQQTSLPVAKLRPKSREGKKTVAGHFDPAIAWQLRKLAVDLDVSVQTLLKEALSDLFEKHHLPRLTD